MQYPMMRGGGVYRVVSSPLNGGVNLSDMPGQVEDNQLTDCRNVWWHKGALRTRPGTVLTDAGGIPPQITVRISEQEVLLAHYTEQVGGLRVTVRSLHATAGLRPLGYFDVAGVLYIENLLAAKDNDRARPFILYSPDGTIYRTWYGNTGVMSAVLPYVPQVTVEKFDATSEEYKQVTLQGYNLLTPDYRFTVTSDWKREWFTLPGSGVPAEVTVSVMLYNVLTKTLRTVSVSGRPGTTVDTALSSNEDIAYAEVVEEWVDNPNAGPGKLCVMRDAANGKIRIFFNQINLDNTTLPFPRVTSNNIEVAVRCVRTDVFQDSYMTLCSALSPMWFGGSHSGLGSGTRLFCASGAAVRWSEVNNALYFPENNDAYIGKSSENITALAKQGELLLVFKQNEIHALQYVAGSSLTLEAVENGADMHTEAAIFPITPIHPTIGCDCPNSLRLVNNRLVWATSDAHIYMLPSVNPYSERNVRDITALIRRRLEQYKGDTLRHAMAAEYAGHYMLALPNGTLFLLDVGNSAFQSYAYYASEKKANRLLPWYLWDVPAAIDTVASLGDDLLMLAQVDGVSKVLRLDGWTDSGQAIECHFATKLYDFGQPDKLKRIGELHLTVGSEEGSCVVLSYRTERDTLEDAYRIETSEVAELYDADYLMPYRLTPNINRACKFGLRCDSAGVMAVEAIRLNYSVQGDAR